MMINQSCRDGKLCSVQHKKVSDNCTGIKIFIIDRNVHYNYNRNASML